MAAALGRAAVVRHATASLAPRLSSRSLATTRVLRQETAVPSGNVGTVQTQKKPIGAFRGGIVGFLAGFSLAASFAAYHLLDEYKQASAALQASVEELQLNTEKISAHVRRIEAVEKDLKALSGVSASREDVSKLRSELKKLYDGLHVEFLDLRSHVWGMQQDLHSLSKKDSSQVRVV